MRRGVADSRSEKVAMGKRPGGDRRGDAGLGACALGELGAVLLENDMEVEVLRKGFREKERCHGKTETVDSWRLALTLETRVQGARWWLCRRVLRDA